MGDRRRVGIQIIFPLHPTAVSAKENTMRFLIAVIALIGGAISNVIDRLRSFRGAAGAIPATEVPAKNPKRRRQVMIVLIVVSSVAAIGVIANWGPNAPKINRAPFIGLGEVVAEETDKVIDHHGMVVPVVANYHTTGSSPMTDEWKAFTRQIKKSPGVELAEPVLVQLDETTGEPSLTRADFDKLVRGNAGAAALVLLVGLPVWDAGRPLTLPRVAPKIVAIHTSALPAKPYLTSAVATVLITRRLAPDSQALAAPRTPRQYFDKYFQVVTAKDSESLPD